jgi:Rrf2 family protein
MAKNGQDKPIPANEIARRTGVSVKYLEHLISQLNKHGILESIRGPKGGQILVRDPKSLSVGEIVRLLENDLRFVECIDDPECCNRSANCRTRRMWGEAKQAMMEVLDRTTIYDLAYEEA